MTRRKGDLESIRGRIGRPMYRIGPEVMVLALLPIRDDGRPGGLELLDRVPDSGLIQGLECGIRRTPLFRFDRIQQGFRPGDTANRFGWKGQTSHRLNSIPFREPPGE